MPAPAPASGNRAGPAQTNSFEKANCIVTNAAEKTHCQLYLIVDALAGEATSARLGAALSAAPIASALLIPPTSGKASSATITDHLRPLVEIAQDSGVAVLVPDDIALMRDLGCDGVHLGLIDGDTAPIEAMRAARNGLLDNFIAGAETGSLRDDAMQLGESGADYLAFPIINSADDLTAAQNNQLQLVSWWAEIFEIPCVAFDVTTADQAAALAAAGADFVAIRLPTEAPAAEVKLYVETFATAIE